jgi:pyruvate formate lyase activating enzyme
MKIGALQRFSLIDYPGKIAALLFSQGCPFSCPFCHNPSLVDPKQFTKPISLTEVKSFLLSRKNEIEAVVFSGGEPTIHLSLPELMQEIKEMGFLTKLDTAGTRPEMIETLLKKELLDYIAMDIKGPLARYGEITRSPCMADAIQKSIQLMIGSKIPYEFRSTILPSIHQKEDILAMAKMIAHARLYYLQAFRNTTTLSSLLKHEPSFSEEEMRAFQQIAAPFVQECHIR